MKTVESANDSNAFDIFIIHVTVINVINVINLFNGRGDSPLSPIMNGQPVHSPAAYQSMNDGFGTAKVAKVGIFQVAGVKVRLIDPPCNL